MNSSSSNSTSEFYRLFDRCNATELYQIARRNGFVVLPSVRREDLIRIIIGEQEPPPLEKHEIDEYRFAIMRFLIDHRRRLETQLDCPARSFQPDACFACVDTQVMHCLTSNGKENQRLIQLRKK